MRLEHLATSPLHFDPAPQNIRHPAHLKADIQGLAVQCKSTDRSPSYSMM